MLQESSAAAACSPRLLRPSDLKRLAPLTGSVPLLIGASATGKPAAVRVYSLCAGAMATLEFLPHGSQLLASPGQKIETLLLSNCWRAPQSLPEYYRPYILRNLRTTVAFDFYAQSCVRTAVPPLPLHIYWHRVAPGNDCVCANGILSTAAAAPDPVVNFTGDAFVLVDLAVLNPKPRNLPSGDEPVEPSLILGCATRLPLQVGREMLVVEVQRNWRQFKGGMMFREQLSDAEGMLFAYSRPERASFYMANTKSPLSCAYIDPAGIIREIHDMTPFNRNPIRAGAENIQFVLETNQGWFARHDVPIGTAVLIANQPPGKLFFGT